jgi:23S rRNA pseudouridine1911/1915/1917 synthase
MAEANHQSVQTATVGADGGGARLDRYLSGLDHGLSRTRIKALIEEGRVSVGGRTVKEASYRVKSGEQVTLSIPEPVDTELTAQRIPLDVVFEDEYLIVVDKPAGLVVHPAPGNPDGTLVNALLAHCGESLRGIGGVRRPGIVHRLDKDTSGLLVAAKTAEVHAALVELFQAHDIDRQYAALVWGVPRPSAGRIETLIGRDPNNRKKMAVVTRNGRSAITNFEVEARFGDAAALVRCRLETGRTHQIRVHMAHQGYPVIGDPLYARAGGRRLKALPAAVADAVAGFGRQALHAGRLGFRHPATGEALQFDRPPPDDMMHLIDLLDAAFPTNSITN